MNTDNITNNHEMIHYTLKARGVCKDVRDLIVKKVPLRYEYVERTTGEKLAMVALCIFTLGIWRAVKNNELVNALQKGNVFKAKQAIRAGATHLISQELFRELIHTHQKTAVLFMAEQASKAFGESGYYKNSFFDSLTYTLQSSFGSESQKKKIADIFDMIYYVRGIAGETGYSKGKRLEPSQYIDGYIGNLFYTALQKKDAASIEVMREKGISTEIYGLPDLGITSPYATTALYSSAQLRFWVEDCQWNVDRPLPRHFILPLTYALDHDDVENLRWLLEEKHADPKGLLTYFKENDGTFFPHKCVDYLKETGEYPEALTALFQKYVKLDKISVVLSLDGYLAREEQTLLNQYKRYEQAIRNVEQARDNLTATRQYYLQVVG